MSKTDCWENNTLKYTDYYTLHIDTHCVYCTKAQPEAAFYEKIENQIFNLSCER